MNAPRHSLLAPLTRLTPDDAHYFFGYYDLPAWGETARGWAGHLAHRIGFMDRIPTADDEAEVGWVSATGESVFAGFGKTRAWNFQQGAMLQVLPDGQVLYNQRQEQGFCSVVTDPRSGTRRSLAHAVANVDPRGRFALGVNFSRLMDFRPGYGYAGVSDPFGGEAQPADDGIVREDLLTGQSRLILSLQELGEVGRPFFGDRKILVNHLNLNPSGMRFVSLVRSFPDGGGGRLRTLAITANADGSEPRVLWGGGVASHYHWRDDATLAMVIQEPGGRITLAEFNDREGAWRLIDPGFFLDDGHCSYSPDGRWMLYDSYPVESRRHLYLYDLHRREGRDLGWVASIPVDNPVALETRCDLHPRWRPDGRAISFDSMHEGFRAIYLLDLSEIV